MVRTLNTYTYIANSFKDDFCFFYSLTKPADFTECVGDELPVGWEQAYDYHRGGIYYVDHRNRNYTNA